MPKGSRSAAKKAIRKRKVKKARRRAAKTRKGKEATKKAAAAKQLQAVAEVPPAMGK